MKLYQGWVSSASWRVRWALAHKGVPYERVWLDIAAGEHLEVLAPLNPLRTVPTLQLDDGSVLSESVAIIEWLDETYAHAPLLPADKRQRARVRELVQLVNADIHPLQNTIVRKAVSDDEAVQRRWCARWIERGLQAYEAQLDTQPARFSAGDELTMADLFLVPQTQNALRFGADLSACPRVRRVFAECLTLAEAQTTHPDQATAQAAAERAAGAPAK